MRLLTPPGELMSRLEERRSPVGPFHEPQRTSRRRRSTPGGIASLSPSARRLSTRRGSRIPIDSCRAGPSRDRRPARSGSTGRSRNPPATRRRPRL